MLSTAAISRTVSRKSLSAFRKNIRSFSVSSIVMSDSDTVLTEERGQCGIITLNKPKALNALNLEMVKKIAAPLRKWETTKALVIVKGNGGKAFCAGGDVRSLVELPPSYGSEFFQNEYTLDHLIGTYKIPYIALIDGITMGGGLGISVHGKYRVATEKTLIAMPETAIGLFPDVGGSYFLSRLQGKLGMYLGLTGARLKGVDVQKSGIATHYCASERIPELEKNLLTCRSYSDVDNVLKTFCPIDKKEFIWQKYLKQINNCFAADTVEEIFKNLENDNSEWAKQTIETLRKMSPTSLKVSHRQIELGAGLNLGQCLQMENRLGTRHLIDSDFAEGVRALLIEKDNKPKWRPPTLAEVTEERVQHFFEKLPASQELPIDESRNVHSKL